MDLDVEARWSDLLVEATPLILLDTNAVIWLHRGDRRVSGLAARAARLYASPATILELQFLIEAGRLRLRAGASVNLLVHDDRWVIDDPASAAWFEKASEVGFTRPLRSAHRRARAAAPLAVGDRRSRAARTTDGRRADRAVKTAAHYHTPASRHFTFE
jgi:predicted nucleic acid-binding protein